MNARMRSFVSKVTFPAMPNLPSALMFTTPIDTLHNGPQAPLDVVAVGVVFKTSKDEACAVAWPGGELELWSGRARTVDVVGVGSPLVA